jgi:drug/metabolite transporter (DMT)-like permease
VKIRRAALAKTFVATLLFGSVPACIRSMAMDSYALGVWRLALAAAGLTLMASLRRRTSPVGLWAAIRPDAKIYAAIGAAFGFHWLLYFQSIKVGDASIGALAFSTCGVQLPLLGWAFGFGRPPFGAMLGVALAMVGSALCVSLDAGGQGRALAMLLGLGGATMYAVLPLLHQRHAHLEDDLRTWAQFTFALPVFLLTAPAADWTLAPGDLWRVLYLGLVVNLVGHFLWVQICTELPLPLTSALGYLQLPLSLAINTLALGEALTPRTLLGAGCILAGNALALASRNEAIPPATPED